MSSQVASIGRNFDNEGFNSPTALLGQMLEFQVLKPAIIVGTLPLYFVDRIQTASSHDIIKSRSIGWVFFAHQKMTRSTLLINVHGYLVGPYRWIYLEMLEGLHMYGAPFNSNFVNKIIGNVSLASGGLPSVLIADNPAG